MSLPDAEPGYFGPDDAPLFGWLHRAAAPGALGLVVCNPFGFEAVCAHRTLRHLAAAAAAAGVPALRFDYAGCGNSHGGDGEPDLLPAWVASVHAAIAALREATGVERVVLLGLRLGATLAALAAADRDDVQALVAIAPVVVGRTWLRELRMLGETLDSTGRPMPPEPGVLESAGFVLPPLLAAALEAVDLRQSPRPPAAEVLVAERDDLPAAPDWPATLERQGARVERAAWPGYAALMTDPQRAVVPQAWLDGVAAALQRWRVDANLAPARPVLRASARLGAVQESALRLDAGGTPLFGVLATPADAAPRAGLLMLNSGAVHHIGPNRLWVDLARTWAARGWAVLRLDLSGLGDSPPRPGAAENVVYSPHAGADIGAALVRLRALTGVEDCRLLGLCSGAYHAFKAAVAGQPVSAGLLINPLTFFWDERWVADEGLRDYLPIEATARYRRLLRDRRTWRRLLTAELDLRSIAEAVLRRTRTTVGAAAFELARALRLPLRRDLARELVRATAQGVRLHFVFALGDPGAALLRLQGGTAVERLAQQGSLTLDTVDGADHTFTRRAARRRLVERLERLLGPLPP